MPAIVVAVLFHILLAPLIAPRLSVPASNAAGLALPAGAFAPGALTDSAPVAPSAFDNPANWPRLYHAGSYAALGLKQSYYQRATWVADPSSSAAVFDYAGSIFKTEPGAYDAWQDVSTYLPRKLSNVQYLPCPDLGVPTCTRWFLVGNNDIDEIDDMIQVGRCLVEARTFATHSLFTAQNQRITATLTTIADDGVIAARKVCRIAQPAVASTPEGEALGLDAIRLEPIGARPDWNLVKLAATVATTGRPISISTYYTVTGAAAGTRVRFHEVIAVGRRTLLDQHDRPFTLPASSAHSRHTIQFTPPSAGSYRVTETVQAGAVSVSGTLIFRAR